MCVSFSPIESKYTKVIEYLLRMQYYKVEYFVYNFAFSYMQPPMQTSSQ